MKRILALALITLGLVACGYPLSSEERQLQQRFAGQAQLSAHTAWGAVLDEVDPLPARLKEFRVYLWSSTLDANSFELVTCMRVEVLSASQGDLWREQLYFFAPEHRVPIPIHSLEHPLCSGTLIHEDSLEEQK